MPDPEGPRRFRVLVGYEFTAADEQAAYARMVDYVARRNAALAGGNGLDARDLRLSVGPPGPASVTVLEGALTDDERARVDADRG